MKKVIFAANTYGKLPRHDAPILDVDGEEKSRLTVKDLVEQFHTIRGEEFSMDRMLLV
ncbi:hypothetical protein BMS3Abin14_02234 [bacterium BMS3Abin14]|nr:hypothetical protein BMS3Abin14_02234 [bacterium BMS3Abin14]